MSKKLWEEIKKLESGEEEVVPTIEVLTPEQAKKQEEMDKNTKLVQEAEEHFKIHPKASAVNLAIAEAVAKLKNERSSKEKK